MDLCLGLFFVVFYYGITWIMNMEKFSDYKNYKMDPNKKVKVPNKFTKDSNCDQKDVEDCSKFGKVALNNFMNNDGGCMCSDMESGV
jgi:hypothetical protein